MRASAYVLINVDVGKSRHVYEKLEKLPEVKHIDAVTGPYDIIATIETDDYPGIGKFVLEKIHKIKGVTHTITCYIIRFET